MQKKGEKTKKLTFSIRVEKNYLKKRSSAATTVLVVVEAFSSLSSISFVRSLCDFLARVLNFKTSSQQSAVAVARVQRPVNWRKKL